MYLAASLAWSASLAFVGWWMWLRDHRGATVVEEIALLKQETHHLKLMAIPSMREGIGEIRTMADETRAIVDNLQLRAGLTPKR